MIVLFVLSLMWLDVWVSSVVSRFVLEIWVEGVCVCKCCAAKECMGVFECLVREPWVWGCMGSQASRVELGSGFWGA